MPLVQLLQLQYKDMEDSRKVADVYNENIRQLEWLLSHNLDSANIRTDTTETTTGDVAVDEYGINPEYIKFYPNKCFNSSFEVYDTATLLPSYWDTDGVVSPDAAFDGTYSLKLTPGQYAIQKVDAAGRGLSDPVWWLWCIQQAVAGATRFSFRLKGTLGLVRVSVWQAGASVPLWVWKTNAAGEEYAYLVPAPYYLDVATSSDWARPDASSEWATSLRTFGALPSIAGGVISLRFDNIGTADVYLDAVTEEADWTGKWPSFYTPGPMSEANTATGSAINPTTTPQLFSTPYNSAGVTFTLAVPVVDIYPAASIVTSDPSPFASSAIELICVPITGLINGQTVITGCYVYPKGSSVPSSASGAQITLIVFGTPISSVHWTNLDYADSWWGSAIEICQVLSDYIQPWGNYPTNWPSNDLTAEWIWGMQNVPGTSVPVGDCYFRKKFTVISPVTITIYAGVDDNCYVYFDDQEVIVKVDAYGAQTSTKVSASLIAQPGEHIIAVKGINLQSGVIRYAGIVISVQDSSGNVILHSDASWKCLAYPSPAPI